MLSTAFNTDTIAAIATASGAAGVGVVRISGRLVPEIAQQIIRQLPDPRQAVYCQFYNQAGAVVDQGLALYFAAPHSFTGESVLELQGHGGDVVLSLVLEAAQEAGARLAEPGEFSERAFLNGKMDLAQAEAVADLIHSASRAAASAALQTLTGVFSERITQIETLLMAQRTHLEALLNFPDEPVDHLASEQVQTGLALLLAKLQALLAQAQEGKLLNDGLNVVLVGPPNSGKSSLMNWFSREETSIVSDVPGTTRDVVRAQIQLQGLPINLSDTAGLREKTVDSVEQLGIERTHQMLSQADLVLLVSADDATADPVLPSLTASQRLLKVRNKIDLTGSKPGYRQKTYYISVHQEAGLGALTQDISDLRIITDSGEGVFTARSRHIEALREAATYLEAAIPMTAMEEHLVLLAEHLRLAHEALGRITGRVSSEELLGEIFRQFCIGK